MCGTGKESGSDAIHGGARDVAPYYFFGVNIPSSGLASFGEGASPFFTVKKRPDSLFHEKSSIKFLKTAYVA